MTVRKLVESMIDQFLEAEINVEGTLNDIKKELQSKYEFEVAITKSTLGGGEPTYFMKVFGPKSTWKNGIAMNSPVHMTIRIDGGKMDMTNNSYQIKKAKMRKTAFSSEGDMKKKLMAYFDKNASTFKEILGESLNEGKSLIENKTSYEKMKKDAIKAAWPMGGNAQKSQKSFLEKLEREGLIDITSTDPLDGSYDYELTRKGKDYYKTIKESLNEAETTISKLRDMVNKRTKTRLLNAGGKLRNFTLQQASKIVSLHDNQKDKASFEKALNDKDGFGEIMGMISESLNESDYKVMHKTFTDAVNTAKEKAEKAGYTIDDDEWFRKVSSGPRKPSKDKTNRYTVELLTKRGNDAKKALSFQVYNTGNAYELNAYIN